MYDIFKKDLTVELTTEEKLKQGLKSCEVSSKDIPFRPDFF